MLFNAIMHWNDVKKASTPASTSATAVSVL
jgi:hypothetical protein